MFTETFEPIEAFGAFATEDRRVSALPGAIREAVPLGLPVYETHDNLYEAFGTAMTRFRSLAPRIRDFMRKAYWVDQAIPEFPVLEMAYARRPYEELKRVALENYERAVMLMARMLECQFTGKITWPTPDTADFTYYEIRDQQFLWQWDRHTVRHSHQLVRAESLPFRQAKPDARAARLQSLLPHELQPHTRIVSGLLVTKSSEDLGSAYYGDTNYLKKPVPAAVASPDPALCLGDLVLHGWEG